METSNTLNRIFERFGTPARIGDGPAVPAFVRPLSPARGARPATRTAAGVVPEAALLLLFPAGALPPDSVRRPVILGNETYRILRAEDVCFAGVAAYTRVWAARETKGG